MQAIGDRLPCARDHVPDGGLRRLPRPARRGLSTMEEAVAIDSTELGIVVPADARLLRVLRLVASGVASLGSLSLDAVEEARVAVDGIGATLRGASNGAPLPVRFTRGADQLLEEGRTQLGPPGLE